MKSVVIQIGNSDDNLAQKQWSLFVLETRSCIENMGGQIHFWGGSLNYEPWQNVCCVFELADERVEVFLDTMASLRRRWKQESAAVLIGETKFI